MKFRMPQSLAVPALFVSAGIFAALTTVAAAQTGRLATEPAVPQASTQQSPFGGTVVEDVIARVNDQIISRSDYERAEQDLEQRAKQQNLTPQQVEEARKDLLRDLVDQQLLLSKGKELSITGDTELIRELDEIRKQNHLESMEDLQKAAEEQGVNYEDFKAQIRDRIITQQVIRDEVGRHLNLTQADVQRYYNEHKDQFTKAESVRLDEIMVPVSDPANLDTAQAKAADMEAKLKSGADFDQLVKEAAQGEASPQGGDLGIFTRGKLPKVIEDQTFSLQAGGITAPIRTKQGIIILKVTEHTPAGQTTLKDVEPQVEDALAQERVQPAVRAYLNEQRMEAAIVYKPGYVDSAAVANPNQIVYSAYTPPAPKKKKKAVRTRFRGRERGHQPTQTASAANGTSPAGIAAPGSGAPAGVPSLADVPHGAETAAAGASDAAVGSGATTGAATGSTTSPATGNAPVQTAANTPVTESGPTTGKTRESSRKKSSKSTDVAGTMKPGKKEKIRFGQAPRETLPTNNSTQNIDAHATAGPENPSLAAAGTTPPGTTGSNGAAAGTPPGETQIASADIPESPPQVAKGEKKRFSDRAKLPKLKKPKGAAQADPFTPPPPTAQEIADQKTQAAPLGLAGDTLHPAKKKKVKPTEKTRLQDEKKPSDTTPAQTPAATPATTGTAPLNTTGQGTTQTPTTPSNGAPNSPATPLGTNPIQTPPTNTQGVPTPGEGNPATPPPPPQ